MKAGTTRFFINIVTVKVSERILDFALCFGVVVIVVVDNDDDDVLTF